MVRTSSLLSLALLAVSAIADQTLTDAETYPVEFPVLSASGADKFPMDKCGTFTLEEASIDDIQAAYAAGTLTTVQLANCYIKRIHQTNDYIK